MDSFVLGVCLPHLLTHSLHPNTACSTEIAPLPAKQLSKQTPQQATAAGTGWPSPTLGTKTHDQKHHLVNMHNLQASSNCTATMQDLAWHSAQAVQHPVTQAQHATVTILTTTLSIQTAPGISALHTTPTSSLSHIMLSTQEFKHQPQSSAAGLPIAKLLHRQHAAGQHCLCTAPLTCTALKSCHLWLITHHPFRTCPQALAST